MSEYSTAFSSHALIANREYDKMASSENFTQHAKDCVFETLTYSLGCNFNLST